MGQNRSGYTRFENSTEGSSSPPPPIGFINTPPPPPYPHAQNVNMDLPPDYNSETFASSPLDDRDVRRMFIRKVFGVLSVQMAVSCSIVAIFTFDRPVKLFVQRNEWMYWISFVFFACSYLTLMCCNEFRRRHPHNLIALGVLTLSISYMIGVMSSFHDTDIVMMAVGITFLVCCAVMIFSLQTKYDFTSRYGLLCVCSSVLFFFVFFSMFFYSRVVHLIYSALCALLFTCYLAIDTQRLLGNKELSLSPEEYVSAALHLYLDIIYIFIHILNLIKSSRG